MHSAMSAKCQKRTLVFRVDFGSRVLTALAAVFEGQAVSPRNPSRLARRRNVMMHVNTAIQTSRAP